MTPTARRDVPKRARALAHPTRRRVLQILSERVASPREIAEELGQPLGQLSYHVRWLAAGDFIELVDTAPRRGAIEHYYRATARPVLTDDQWRRLPAARRHELSEHVLRDIWRHVLDAADDGALAEVGVHLSRTPLTLDEHGARQVTDLLAQVVDQVLQIQAESAQRSAAGGGRRTELAILHFDRSA
jgi:DNA-binding transcriptional ArsR family regulator